MVNMATGKYSDYAQTQRVEILTQWHQRQGRPSISARPTQEGSKQTQ